MDWIKLVLACFRNVNTVRDWVLRFRAMQRGASVTITSPVQQPVVPSSP